MAKGVTVKRGKAGKAAASSSKPVRPKTRALKRVIVAPADQKVLRTLPAATATDGEDVFVIAREFEQHLCGEHSPSTAVKYRRTFLRLFSIHKKTFSAMASDEFVSVVGHMKENLSGSYSAAMKTFGAFWSKRRLAKAPNTRISDVASAEDRERFPVVMKSFEKHLEKEYGPRTSAQYRRAFSKLFNSDGKSLEAMASEGYAETLRRQPQRHTLRASAKAFKTFFAKKGRPSGEIALDDLQPFLDHMHAKGRRRTANDYGGALRKLARLHRKSLDAMASQEYLDKVRKLNWHAKYAASVASFCKFRSVEQEASAQSASAQEAPARRAQREHPVSQEASAQSLQPFLDHLHAEKGQATAVQYGQALRKLANVHQKSLDAMATQEYLDRVRSESWNSKYTACVASLCKFRGVELGARRDQAVAQLEHAVAQAGNAQGLQPFLDHLHSEVGRATAVQYEQALRTLVKMHRKSLDTMASQEYLDKVRKLNWHGKYAASIRALCKFHGGTGWSQAEQREQANAVTSGCMIDACVRCGLQKKAMEIFQDMKRSNKHHNTILYTTLIKGYGMDKDLRKALALFREMKCERVPYNRITYNSIIDVCIKCNDVQAAENLFGEMTAPGSNIEPDLITFSTLIKGYCHMGDLDKALQVAENMKSSGLRCDELVYNTLMDGCVRANDLSAGIGLLAEMVRSGLTPSPITYSILVRLYQKAGSYSSTGAGDAVGQLYEHHGLPRPSPPEGRSRGRRGRGHHVSVEKPRHAAGATSKVCLTAPAAQPAALQLVQALASQAPPPRLPERPTLQPQAHFPGHQLCVPQAHPGFDGAGVSADISEAMQAAQAQAARARAAQVQAAQAQAALAAYKNVGLVQDSCPAPGAPPSKGGAGGSPAPCSGQSFPNLLQQAGRGPIPVASQADPGAGQFSYGPGVYRGMSAPVSPVLHFGGS